MLFIGQYLYCKDKHYSGKLRGNDELRRLKTKGMIHINDETISKGELLTIRKCIMRMVKNQIWMKTINVIEEQ